MYQFRVSLQQSTVLKHNHMQQLSSSQPMNEDRLYLNEHSCSDSHIFDSNNDAVTNT